MEKKVTALEESVKELISSVTLLVRSDSETKDTLSAISNSLATLVEVQVHTDNNTKNISKLYRKADDLESWKTSITKEMTTSCSLKDKEINASASKTFAKCLAVSGAMFLIFISAVAYFNNSDGAIYEKINKHHTEIVKNETNVNNIDKLLKEIRDIVRDNSRHTH